MRADSDDTVRVKRTHGRASSASSSRCGTGQAGGDMELTGRFGTVLRVYRLHENPDVVGQIIFLKMR